MKKERPTRADFRHFCSIQPRWSDNDAYGHINNVVYYEYFDTAVNMWLVENDILDIETSPIISIVVETGCTYFESAAYPQALEAGIAVDRIGTSSIVYATGIFRRGDDQVLCAGRFVHVTVERATMRPVPMPDFMRTKLTTLLR
jgi:acyl-CoA thioester hydrolase